MPADREGRMRRRALAGGARRPSVPDDRLRPGRRGEHRRVRRSRAGSSRSRATRAPGCTSTARSASGRRRARRSRTSSRATSARTRGRPTRTSGSTSRTTAGSPFCAHPDDHARGDGVRRAVPRRLGRTRRARPDGLQPGVLAPRARGCPSGRRSARSAARASRSSSSAAARTRGRSPSGVAALPGCEVLNDVVLNQVLFRFDDDERRPRGARRRAGEAARRG